KANSDFFSLAHGDERTKLQIGDNRDELKQRISVLLKYVSDAQFRFDVIRPAFYNSHHHHHKTGSALSRSNSEATPEMDNSDELSCPQPDSGGARCTVSTTTGSDTDYRAAHSVFHSSLISCMLASYTQ